MGFKYVSSIKPLKYQLNDRKFASSLFSIIPSNNKNIISTYNPDIDRVESIELNDELKSSFMSYALSTILGRAIPDARDGLKPVHRRVLYAMHELGLFPDAGYRKSARVVGEVLGKFHPHGDQSVYDVLVRMAQDFVMLHPLVAGHGNFGSIDDDPAAAMRYTESKLSHVCYDTLLADINEDTVDFVPNFDGNEVEPRVLPARLPLLLLNGASGIAVGMATNIPPHNLNELVNAVIAIIDNPDITISELITIVPAPDFPTGGKIMGIDGINKFYSTGSGSMIMRAKCEIDVITTNSKSGNRTRTAIIITELPYMTNKASLLERIADMVNDKKLEGISDIRDESDRDGTRVVIEIKKDAIANIVLNNLYKKTALQTSFSGNMLAVIDDGKRPQRLNLKQVLDIFIKFRLETIRRRTSFRLKKLEVREHIVLGMIKALSHIDKIIEIIRTSSDSNVVKQQLSSEEYGFSIEQIDAILSLRLGRLTSLEEEKLRQEHNQLSTDITSCRNILNDNSLVNDILKSELKELSTKYGQPRRTEIESGSTAIINDIDLIVNNKFVVTVTESGYIKRIPYEEFESQNRGSKGKSVTKLHSDEDTISQFFISNAHDSIMFVTNRGIAYSIKCYEIPIAARTSKGTPVPQLLAIPDDDKITSTIPIDKFTEDDSLILLTSQGYCKRTLLSAFKSIASRGLVIITLRENDSVKLARRCKNTDQVVLATRGGYATRFAVDEISCKGRSSMGVQALTLQDDDEIADMDIFEGNSTNGPKCFVAITDNGYGKRILIDDFRSKRRKTTGVIAIKLKDRTSKSKSSENLKHDALRCMRFCYPGDEITISTSKGTVSKQLVDDLTIQSRSASGYIIQRLSKDDAILTIDVVTNKDLQLINS